MWEIKIKALGGGSKMRREETYKWQAIAHAIGTVAFLAAGQWALAIVNGGLAVSCFLRSL
jgi:aminopeptidase-like protein